LNQHLFVVNCPAAVEKAKYRLKKKITLEKDESLDTYIQQL